MLDEVNLFYELLNHYCISWAFNDVNDTGKESLNVSVLVCCFSTKYYISLDVDHRQSNQVFNFVYEGFGNLGFH